MLSSCNLAAFIPRSPILPGDLTLGDVHTSLGHEAHPSLGLLGAEGVEVVDVRRLLCDLKVADAAVPLRSHVKKTQKKNTENIKKTRHININQTRSLLGLETTVCLRIKSVYLSTEVDHVRIGIIIW